MALGMLGLPSLHGQLVLFELVAPVRVNLAIVRLCRRPTCLSVYGEVVAAECADRFEVQVIMARVPLGE